MIIFNLPSNSNEKNDKNVSEGERIFFWIGTILAILTSLITVYDRLIKPSPPDLIIKWSLSNSDKFNIVPEIAEQDSTITKPFPFGVRIFNNGDETAQNVQLRIIHPPNMTLGYLGDLKVETSCIFSDPSEMLMETIQLQNIHSKNEYLLDDKLIAVTENILDIPVPVTFADGIKATIHASIGAVFQLTFQISADNMPERIYHLYLGIGSNDVFKKSKEKFWKQKENVFERIDAN